MNETIDEKMNRLASYLNYIRDKAKRLLGDNYQSHMTSIGQNLLALAEEQNKPLIETAAEHCKKNQIYGNERVLLMAAAAELLCSPETKASLH